MRLNLQIVNCFHIERENENEWGNWNGNEKPPDNTRTKEDWVQLERQTESRQTQQELERQPDRQTESHVKTKLLIM